MNYLRWLIKKSNMTRFNRNFIVGAFFFLAVALSVWPFRALIINDMYWHMDIQIPLLITVGVLLRLPKKQHFYKLARFNLYGLTSFIASQFILAFWMLPISLDRAIIHWQYDLVKLSSLIICGFLIRLSFCRSTLVIETFFVGYFLSMMIWVGQYYLNSDERLCNVYSQDSQKLAGSWLILYGLLLSVAWIASKLLKVARIQNRS